jgi:hypothetical protein
MAEPSEAVERSGHTMINRRIFLQNSVLVVAAPALANLMPLSFANQSDALPHSEPIPIQHTEVDTPMNSALLKIDGWDYCNDITFGRSQSESVDRFSNNPIDSQAVIRLTQSWRASWR